MKLEKKRKQIPQDFIFGFYSIFYSEYEKYFCKNACIMCNNFIASVIHLSKSIFMCFASKG